MTSLRTLIAASFADVPTVSTSELAAELASSRKPLLLDARSAAEYAVSHLPGARHAPPEDEARLFRELPRDTPIVVYCSVGVRSARLARALSAAGAERVFNLRGGLFDWANRGLPLVGPAGPAQRVHGYDAEWAVLLDARLRA